MCQAENKSEGTDLVTCIVVCNTASCSLLCVCVCARASPEACRGPAQELDWAEGISWPSQVRLGFQWLTLIILRLNKKASVFTIKPTFIGETGRQGRLVSSLCPRIPACIKILARPSAGCVTLIKSLQLAESGFTELQTGSDDNGNDTYARGLVNTAGFVCHFSDQDPGQSKCSE